MALQSKSYTNWLQLYIQNRFQSPLPPWADGMSPEWKLLSRSFEKFGSMVDSVSSRNFQPHSDVFWNQGMMVMGFQHEGFMMPSIVTGQQILGQWLAFFGGRLTLVGFEDCFYQTLELKPSEGDGLMARGIQSARLYGDITTYQYYYIDVLVPLQHLSMMEMVVFNGHCTSILQGWHTTATTHLCYSRHRTHWKPPSWPLGWPGGRVPVLINVGWCCNSAMKFLRQLFLLQGLLPTWSCRRKHYLCLHL